MISAGMWFGGPPYGHRPVQPARRAIVRDSGHRLSHISNGAGGGGVTTTSLKGKEGGYRDYYIEDAVTLV